MDENIEPIYDFSSLRNFLIQKGYIVEKGQAYREIRPEEITVDAITKGEIDLRKIQLEKQKEAEKT